jgi:hypothetical protein
MKRALSLLLGEHTKHSVDVYSRLGLAKGESGAIRDKAATSRQTAGESRLGAACINIRANDYTVQSLHPFTSHDSLELAIWMTPQVVYYQEARPANKRKTRSLRIDHSEEPQIP